MSSSCWISTLSPTRPTPPPTTGCSPGSAAARTRSCRARSGSLARTGPRCGGSSRCQRYRPATGRTPTRFVWSRTSPPGNRPRKRSFMKASTIRLPVSPTAPCSTTASTMPWPRRPVPTARSVWSTSTWTALSRSTTATGMPPATRYSYRSPTGSVSSCAQRTPWGGSPATSSCWSVSTSPTSTACARSLPGSLKAYEPRSTARRAPIASPPALGWPPRRTTGGPTSS